MIYVLDTNTISFILKGDAQIRQRADEALDAGHELIIPKVVDYEVRRGLAAKRKDRILREYMAFRGSMEIGVIDDSVWERAVEVYASLSQKGRLIGDGDTLIAAFSLINGYPVTRTLTAPVPPPMWKLAMENIVRSHFPNCA